jgi:hypothetical protein
LEEVAAMEANDYLLHGSVPLTCQAGDDWRGVIAVVMTRLMKAWVGLYAQPPRRALPVL